eukprot:Rhum_TRINITY_DN6446_c0_g3::Rhum_TRINITY_DN6446_c0_g3_i1::g.20163::m.20163
MCADTVEQDQGGQETAALHVLVLQHGSHGRARDLQAVRDEVTGLVPGVAVFETDSCSRFGTEQGTLRVAEVVAAELDAFFDRLVGGAEGSDGDAAAATRRIRVCLLGHSMGGLILRHVLVLSRWLRDAPGVEPVLYMSVATPHLGAWNMPAPMRALCGLWGRLASTTCLEMLHGTASLATLCDGPHLAQLARFRRRVACTNVARDHLCGFHACGLTVDDPPTEAHADAACAARVRAHVALRPGWAPTLQDVARAFPAAGDGVKEEIAAHLRALRRLEWTLVCVDYGDSILNAHTDIIGMESVGDPTNKGRVSARHLAGIVAGAFGSCE